MSLHQNIHRLIRVHLDRRPDGQWVQSHALLDQLARAVHPNGSGRAGGATSGTPLPVNSDAIETQQAILRGAQQEEAERSGLTGSTTVILKRWTLEERAEWVEHLGHVTQDYIDTIENLLEPAPPRRPLWQPCPSCGTEWAVNGEGDRRAALTAAVYTDDGGVLPFDQWDIACTECAAIWHATDDGFSALVQSLHKAA